MCAEWLQFCRSLLTDSPFNETIFARADLLLNGGSETKSPKRKCVCMYACVFLFTVHTEKTRTHENKRECAHQQWYMAIILEYQTKSYINDSTPNGKKSLYNKTVLYVQRVWERISGLRKLMHTMEEWKENKTGWKTIELKIHRLYHLE